MTIRLEAADSAVIDRTAAALDASVDIKARLSFRCDKCGSLLAEVGDVPGYGALFVSWWDVEPGNTRVVVNGRELRPRERQKWMTDHYKISGPDKAVDEPLRHGAVALLQLPMQMTQDYPDLMMRCEKHGDCIAGRLDTLKRLRKGSKPVKINAYTTGEFNSYDPPKALRGNGESKTYEVTRTLRLNVSDPTTAEQLQERKAAQGAHIRRRRAERDTP